jgi:mycothiol synthase
VSDLSSRFAARDAAPGDEDGILAVGIARDVEDVGYGDWAVEDVLEELAEARATQVVSEGERVVAYALLEGGDLRIAVHPDACGNGIGTWLREWAEAHSDGVVRQEAAGSNDAARRLFEAAGYRAAQHFWRMTKELGADGPGLAVPWPEGVSTRSYEPGADDGAAYALVQDAFTDIPGNVAREFDEWRALAVGRSQFAPELSTVAGDFAGVALCERWDDGQGYVAYLAVARDWRGRGLGRALLAASLEKMRAAGLPRAALSVNARNESATRLYESVGMQVAARSDRYEKRLG